MAVIAGLIDVSAKASSAMALSIGIVVAASATPAPARADADRFLTAVPSFSVSQVGGPDGVSPAWPVSRSG
ncbi:hypothetical protein H7K45_19370 [Mycobacterium yunnanensis]|uniref:Uncharacterized protein n=1 Tax=Mycobacterium yunnanensis TaxID=368477 RepID=A0A9X2YNM3_9MYCO|nr:hypothetical protein [Mycobacterium yunnanensis]MCV7422712.1 hypothetical protein [Mycobacterium yunnanensis]